MPSYIPCKKNDANGYIFYVSLVSQADTKVMQANPTLAAGDVIIAIDDAAPGNLGTLPVADADFTKRVKVTLSQAETNGDNLTIIFSDAAGAEWCDLTINIQTSAQTLDTIDTNVDDIKAKTDLIGASVALESAGNLAAVKAKTDLIPADITTQLDTNVPAIKAQTDNLPTDPADESLLEAYITSEVDDLITRVKGLDAIYDSVALRALEATLDAIKGAGWTAESLKAIKDAIDALVTGGATAQEVWEYTTRTLTAANFVV